MRIKEKYKFQMHVSLFDTGRDKCYKHDFIQWYYIWDNNKRSTPFIRNKTIFDYELINYDRNCLFLFIHNFFNVANNSED